jgi:hypothetical protein
VLSVELLLEDRDASLLTTIIDALQDTSFIVGAWPVSGDSCAVRVTLSWDASGIPLSTFAGLLST